MKGSTEKRFKCDFKGCTRGFNERYHLNVHMTSHSDERPFPCLFKGCGKFFKTKRAVKTHLPSHSDERPYKCKVKGCPHDFKYNRNLARHFETVHINKKKHKHLKAERELDFNAKQALKLYKKAKTMKKTENRKIITLPEWNF